MAATSSVRERRDMLRRLRAEPGDQAVLSRSPPGPHPPLPCTGGSRPPSPLAHPPSLAPPCLPGRLRRRALVARSSRLGWVRGGKHSPGSAAPLWLAHAVPTHSAVPSANRWCFQIGTEAFSSSI